MPSESEMLAALSQVMDPELGRNIVELKMVRDLQITQAGKASFTLALTIAGCPLKDQMQKNAETALKALPGVKDVEITFGTMTEEEKKAIFGNNPPPLPKINQFNKVTHIIAVLSGKGGVGKSSVTALLAVALARLGQKVGVLDADITGPSIPRLFGLKPGGIRGGEQGMLPAITPLGIKVMSINLLLEQEETAVIWRGPMISGAITQFWTEVLWGKLDTLLVDLPPGTSDAALTVMKSLPIAGVVLVTTPQQLAALVVRKAVSMLHELRVPVIGVVENMSYYTCPDTDKKHEIFGKGHAEEVAIAAGAPVSARLPLDPEITALGDVGLIEKASMPELEGILNAVLQFEKNIKKD